MSVWEILKQLGEYGSYMAIERETDYSTRKRTNYYHLKMSGYIYPDNYEIVDTNLARVIIRAYKDSLKFAKENENG